MSVSSYHNNLESFPNIEAVGEDDKVDEYNDGIDKLTDLNRKGLITQDELHRRSNFISEFMELDEKQFLSHPSDYNTSRFHGFLRAADGVISRALDCLRICFLGTYEVD